MDLENLVIKLGKEIYEKVLTFVQTNKGDDDKYYSNAILKLSDGRKIIVSFDGLLKNLEIWNHHWNEEFQKGSGDSLIITHNTPFGFSIDISLYYLDKDDIDFYASEKEIPYYIKSDLTKEQKETIKLYIEQLYKQIATLEYDKEATHSVNNFTPIVRKQYNIQLFKNKMKELNETNHESNILPSVETAINWWINQITGPKIGGSIGNDFNSIIAMTIANHIFSQTSVDEIQIAKFRELLSKSLMDELSKGIEPNLVTDYGPGGILANAMKESNISEIKVPFKTKMVVGINSVKVSAGYQAEYKEIFNTASLDEKVKVRIKSL